MYRANVKESSYSTEEFAVLEISAILGGKTTGRLACVVDWLVKYFKIWN